MPDRAVTVDKAPTIEKALSGDVPPMMINKPPTVDQAPVNDQVSEVENNIKIPLDNEVRPTHRKFAKRKRGRKPPTDRHRHKNVHGAVVFCVSKSLFSRERNEEKKKPLPQSGNTSPFRSMAMRMKMTGRIAGEFLPAWGKREKRE